MRFAGDRKAAIASAAERAAAAVKRATEEDPGIKIDRKQPPTSQWPLSVLVEERDKAHPRA